VKDNSVPAGVAAITADDLDDLFALVKQPSTATAQAAKQASGGSRPAPLAPPQAAAAASSSSSSGGGVKKTIAPPGASSSSKTFAPAARLAPPPPAAAKPGAKLSEQHQAAVQHMEAGRWKQAADGFAAAMAAAGKDAKALSSAAQYYAVVMLLEKAGSGAGKREARWYRFAAALELADSHRMMVVREAVNRNKGLGNYRCDRWRGAACCVLLHEMA
jgi:hypothetical protein